MKTKIYKEQISKFLECNPDNIFFYWKGRIALYAILKAMGVGSGDEVILPGFTCVVVPNAILYLGAKPVYIDICRDTYNMDTDQLESKITPRTKVVICQNTFGLSSNVEKVLEIAEKYHLFTVEDSTHGFGGFYKGKPNGSYCDAAFYSTQWNKPFSTGIGGILVVNNSELLDPTRELEKKKTGSSVLDRTVLSALILFRKYFVNDFTQNKLVDFFRFLSKHNLIIGSNQGYELQNPEMPDEYFKDISSVQVWAGLKQLKKLPAINRLRKENALEYTKFLKTQNKTYIDEKFFDNHLFLKYPFLVKDRKLFLESAIKSGIQLGDWFLSPLHPIQKELHLWEFDLNSCPEAVDVSSHILNLPTDTKNYQKVLNFLDKHQDEIL